MDHICMGSLISRKHILTSEHCISTESPEGIQIIVGSTNLYEGNAYFIYWWISYDQWATVREIQLEFLENDVAIIRLLNIVPATINLARISAGHNTDFYNIVVQTVGWGSENDSVANNRLQAVSLRVITKENCESRIGRLLNQEIYIEEQQTVCTIANPYALLSWGDSGGPLLNANSIIAINRGICPEVALGDPNVVNYHIGIAYYRPFILELLYFSCT
ncbi:PREDICTED: trypsin iota-like isoform X2 [Ceratosolen solmsi marchali]|nr:PREDICTED: trypsin iota-like isoform X2 [Ceratosolen solmsi marchali]